MKYQWHKIANSEEDILLQENGIAVVEVKEKKICVTKYHQLWHGFAYNCPHAGGLMANGYIDITGNIVCPLHRYKFSLKNGRNTSGEGFYMKTFPVEVREEGIFVGVEGLF